MGFPCENASILHFNIMRKLYMCSGQVILKAYVSFRLHNDYMRII